MLKLRFDLNRLPAQKLEDQTAALTGEMELNEQELASVTGGWAWRDGDEDEGHHQRRRHRRHQRRHRRHDDD